MNYIVYSFHRSGSGFLTRIIRAICEYKKIKYIFDYGTINDLTDNACIFTRNVRFKKPKGYRIIVNIRDPRDVVTSMFFSYCFFHPGKVQPNTGIRKKYLDEGIDSFVLKLLFNKRGIEKYGTGNEENTEDKYEYILDNLLSDDFVLLKYENMIINFDVWLKDLLQAFDINDSSFYKKLLDDTYSTRFKPNKENKYVHKRKVTPGDYKDKLKPDTIKEINEGIRTILNKLKYETI